MDRMLAMIQHTIKNCTIIITHNLHLHVVYICTYIHICMHGVHLCRVSV